MGFLQKAGRVILLASMVVWALSYFPNGNINTSYLARVGMLLEPFGKLMGLPWPALLALLTGAVAKENTIATLGVLYGNIGQTLPPSWERPAPSPCSSSRCSSSLHRHFGRHAPGNPLLEMDARQRRHDARPLDGGLRRGLSARQGVAQMNSFAVEPKSSA